MHGTKDYGNVSPKETTYRLDDMAELAERVGALSSIDRLGDVVFIDSYEDGLCHWKTETNVAGTTITLETNWSQHGGFSVKSHLVANPTAYTKMYRRFPYPVSSKIGAEISATTHAYLSTFLFSLIFYTGVYKITFALRYDAVNGDVYILNNLGAWVKVTTGFYIYQSNELFNNLKIVIDLPNLEYVRYRTPTGTVLLSGYAPLIQADATFMHMYLDTVLYGSASGIIDIYNDSVIITQNEP